jgi:hypothetical protein
MNELPSPQVQVSRRGLQRMAETDRTQAAIFGSIESDGLDDGDTES